MITMKKHLNIILIVLLIANIFMFSCQNKKKDNTYIKKLQLSEETIAVGIYKPTGAEVNNVQYIAEAINIDAGIVWVTLTDADILKSKLENIDVVVFPNLQNGEELTTMDDEIEQIFKDFITKKGKGALGFCNGAKLLTNSEENASLKLIDVKIIDKSSTNNGLLAFNLTDDGKEMFPELKDKESIFINSNSDVAFQISNNSDVKATVIGTRVFENDSFPVFIASKCGLGKLFLSAAHPETTPGMRWMIPRMIRWLYGKDPVWYDKNIVRSDIYNKEIAFNKEFLQRTEELKDKIDTGDKTEQLEAMDELLNYYPWLAAEKVKNLLYSKNNDVQIRAAKYLLDIEYTYALSDLNKAINDERNRKVREQLNEISDAMELMMEQN